MSDEQSQALEALYTAARDRSDTLAELSSVKVAIKASMLEELRLLGVIGLVGRGLFTVTHRGREQVTENRRRSSADD